ncbi:MAG: GNAT family N-acetyltransferase [Planctomycetota bacterium]
MEPYVRELAGPDLPQLVELCREHAAYERAAWDSTDVLREERLDALFLTGASAAERGAQAWVVDAGGRLVGFATTSLERSTWDARCYLHLDCIYLEEPWRGRGLGMAMMTHAAKLAVTLGAVNMQWQTPAWNEDAARFYRRLGTKEAKKLRFTLQPDACARLASPTPDTNRR